MTKKSLWLLTLLVVLAVRLAVAQSDETITWNPSFDDDPVSDILRVMIAAPILGVLFALPRLARTFSARPVLLLLGLR